MTNFAEWLKRQKDDVAGTDKLKRLKQFAVEHAQTWPAASNQLQDFQAAITAEKDLADRDELLVTLGRYYTLWEQAEHAPADRGWWELLTLVALIVTGLAIAGVLIFGIFVSRSFLPELGQVEIARGLITFLFAFALISIVVLVAIAVFWMEAEEIELRYSKVKDLLAILVGIFGTIMGFYFATPSQPPPSPLSLQPLTVTAGTATADSIPITVATRISGGSPPYRYDIVIFDPAGKADTSKLGAAEKRADESGRIQEQVTVPANAATQNKLSVKVIARDDKGKSVESAPQPLPVEQKK